MDNIELLEAALHALHACQSRHEHQRHRDDCPRCAELKEMIANLEKKLDGEPTTLACHV